MIKDKKMCFILSTGRTGTLFFKDYINNTSELATCVHEPRPSRRFIPLSNLYAQNKVSSKMIFNIYSRARASVFHNSSSPIYIESNNFVWACVKALNDNHPDISVLHLIRHPVDYIISHYNHGFWNLKKRLVRKYIPYFVSDLALPSKGKHDPFLILALRWQYINSFLEKYDQSNAYLCIKFEDLFAQTGQSIDSLHRIRAFFGLEEISAHEQQTWLASTKNSASKNISAAQRNYIIEICKIHLEEDIHKYEYRLE